MADLVVPELLRLATLLAIGAMVYIGTLIATIWLHRWQPRRVRLWSRTTLKIARRPILSAAIVGGISLALCSVICLSSGLPRPSEQDEFAYLLASDTYAQGRLTNPTHPMRVFFESTHVFLVPTYNSKYPPGQGLFMALGQRLTGYPIVGVWISTVLACSTLYWALGAFLPRRWALLGGVLSAFHPLVLGWAHSYWGGAVAMFGGALFLGGVWRSLRQPRIAYGLAVGAGLTIMANSRPAEGLVLTLFVGFAVLLRLIRNPSLLSGRMATRLLLPSAVVLGLSCSAMLYNNYQVTGDPLRMPYMVHETLYGMAPLYLWQQARPRPTYSNEQVRRLNEWALGFHEQQMTPPGLIKRSIRKIGGLLIGYVFQLPVLTLPLLALACVWRDTRWARGILFLTVAYVLLLLMQTWLRPHYIAPAATLIFLLLVQGLRHVRQWKLGSVRIGPRLVQAAVLFAVVWVIPTSLQLRKQNEWSWVAARANIEKRLAQTPGRHLVLVRYAPDHSAFVEWVYNGADLESAKILWARERTTSDLHALLDYYSDRQVWLVDADSNNFELLPYVDQRQLR